MLEHFTKAGFQLNHGPAPIPPKEWRPVCPKCHSINTKFLKTKGVWQCYGTRGKRIPMGAYKAVCGHQFTATNPGFPAKHRSLDEIDRGA